MAEGRGKGGGPKVEHGIYKYIRTGVIPKNPSIRGMRKLKKVLDLIEADLIAQLGGPESVTIAELMLLQDYMKAKTITSMIELYINRAGILDARTLNLRKVFDLHPVLNKAYQQYIRLGVDILKTLFPNGLSRKEEEALNIIQRGEIEYVRKDEKESNDERKKKKKD